MPLHKKFIPKWLKKYEPNRPIFCVLQKTLEHVILQFEKCVFQKYIQNIIQR